MGVTREKLYKEVWAEPMITVAARYEVSSSFLARVCTRLRVPRPERGYWAKLKVGKAPPQPALPPAQPGDELEWSRDGNPQRLPPALPRPPASTRRKRPSPAPAERSSHHALCTGVREFFEVDRVSDAGHLRPTKQLLVDLFVTKGLLAYALDTASRLFFFLEDHRHRVVIAPHAEGIHRPKLDPKEPVEKEESYWKTWSPCRPTVTYIGSVAIGLTVYELSEKVEARYYNGNYIQLDQLPPTRRTYRAPSYEWTTKHEFATGRLAVRAFSPYPGTSWEQYWCEKTPGTLPDLFGKIERGLRHAAPIIAKMVEVQRRKEEEAQQRWEEQHREWERQEAVRRQQAEERRRQEAYRTSQDQLLKLAETWARACRLESFFERLTVEAANLDENEREIITIRLERARNMLGGTSALSHFRTWKLPEES